MSSRTLLRVCGAALIIGSLGLIISDVLTIAAGSSDTPPPYAALFALVGIMALVFGLPGLLVGQAAKAGIVGLIGWVLFVCSAMLAIGLYVNALIFLPAVGAQVPQGGQDVAPPASIFAFIIVATLVQLLGGLVLGIATLRARVFPVAIGWLLIASAVLAGLAFPLEGMANTIVSGVSDLLLALALSWSGYLLTKTARTAAQEVPMPARAANG